LESVARRYSYDARSSPDRYRTLPVSETAVAPATATAFAPTHGRPSATARSGLWTRRRLLALLVAYAVGLGGMIAFRGLFISPDRYLVVLLVPALVLGVARPYVRDFLPFVAAILLYEQVRGVAHSLRPEPFYAPMIDFDRFFFGEVPSVTLQDWLWSGNIEWYDQLLGLVARAHFFVPPTILFLIWLTRRELFYRAAVAIVAVSFAGALVFFLFPAAPPWRASDVGLLPELVKIGTEQAAASPVDAPRSFIADLMLPNPYAAVPSLHTAYSLLTFLIALAWLRRVGWAFVGYPLVMWFTIIYFADHYVADIVVGAGMALGAWWLAGRLVRPGGRLQRLAGPFSPPLASARTFGGRRP
jgi:hypothetical protein